MMIWLRGKATVLNTTRERYQSGSETGDEENVWEDQEVLMAV